MSPSIKLISVNVEREKHVVTVAPFLEKERPDVACLQELMDYDIPVFERALDAKCIFVPKMKLARDPNFIGKPGIEGIGIFTMLPVISHRDEYYVEPGPELVDFDFTSEQSKHDTERHPVLFVEIEKDGVQYTIATTHFTWTSNGAPSDTQRADIQVLLTLLERTGEFVLCGDFNAPRIFNGSPGEIFAMLSSRYRDNVPLKYKTSIDIDLHRAGKEKSHELADKMVDGLFTTPRYAASDVELVFGVSDHAAIVAHVSQVTDASKTA